MIFKVIRGQGQGQEMTSVPFRDYFLKINSAIVQQNPTFGDLTCDFSRV